MKVTVKRNIYRSGFVLSRSARQGNKLIIRADLSYKEKRETPLDGRVG
jgi:hypothetical protein